MFKRILAVLGLLVGLAPLVAQPGWTAWLYNSADGSILRVNAAGELVGAVGLPLTQAFNAYGADILVSPSGRYVMYTVYDSTADRPNVQLFIYDPQVESILFSYDLSDVETTSFGYAPKQAAFDEGNMQVAVGLNYADHWEMLVINYGTASVMAQVASHQVEAIGARTIPVIQRYDGESVFFTAVGAGAENQVVSPAFRWNIGTGELSENTVFTAVGAALLPTTGEVIIPAFAADLPGAEDPQGAAYHANTVDVFSGGERFTFYTSADTSIEHVYFIQNGERVLVKSYDADTREFVFATVNRDGTVSSELLGMLSGISGTREGYIGLYTPESGGTGLAVVDTRSDDAVADFVWSSGIGGLRLVYVENAQAVPTGPYPTWGRLE